VQVLVEGLNSQIFPFFGIRDPHQHNLSLEPASVPDKM